MLGHDRIGGQNLFRTEAKMCSISYQHQERQLRPSNSYRGPTRERTGSNKFKELLLSEGRCNVRRDKIWMG
jgi:hypothetical protein